tara:strand:+ start:1193 stop:2038 length:846 start_codon:yes stop_codon:yes gene_type:complete
MNWITNFVRPKLQAIVGKKDIPDNLWCTCPKCSQMLLKKELENHLYVCKNCDHHLRMNAEQRFGLIFGDDFRILKTPKIKPDPLKFKDLKKYADRIKSSQKKNNTEEAVQVGIGRLISEEIVLVVFDFNFMGGSMGLAVGEAIVVAADYAVKNSLPLVISSSSGGARMQEGILSLMQMPRTILAIDELEHSKIPFISLLTDPTTGGVSASFAMLGDVIIAEKGATIGFAGSRVIEETIKEKLPKNFQKSEYLLEKGMVDIVVHRKDLKERLFQIICLLQNK